MFEVAEFACSKSIPSARVTSVKRTSGTDGAAASSRSEPHGSIQYRREATADHDRPRASGRRSTIPFASWITKR